ncbi:hypothetical protein TIFTF001_004070 [Ficus carica]|uniref:Uncharacterized protein n=1 Tax=Ficus carica TaxID=3494 RepID=A0AA87ZEL0_FICCA|nr:hypothetical protein TIFTF001_004070 [Ficus carica]
MKVTVSIAESDAVNVVQVVNYKETLDDAELATSCIRIRQGEVGGCSCYHALRTTGNMIAHLLAGSSFISFVVVYGLDVISKFIRKAIFANMAD